MNVANTNKDLETYLQKATAVSKDNPVVISKFILEAKVKPILTMRIQRFLENKTDNRDIVFEHIRPVAVFLPIFIICVRIVSGLLKMEFFFTDNA